MRVNLNDYVRVRLTEHGREHYRSTIDELNAVIRGVNPDGKLLPYDEIEEDAEGWSKWQLWHLMKTFGPAIRLGFAEPFAMDIEIPEKAET